MCVGGCTRRCNCPTVPCSSGTGAPRKGLRSRPCWRICSCTTRSTCGWRGSSRVVRFERYVDDAVVHCVSERQARQVLAALADTDGRGRAAAASRTRPGSCTARTASGATLLRAHRVHVPRVHLPAAWGADQEREACSSSFDPAISKDALKKIGAGGAVLAAAPPHRILSAADLARWVNPIVRGWMQYYGAFYRSALYPLLTRINAYLMRWLRKKYKRLQGRRKCQQAWQRPSLRVPAVLRPLGLDNRRSRPSGDQDDKSRITRDCSRTDL